MTEDKRLYEVRDHQAQGDYYLRHVSAMTGEGLHAKSAIAGELAHRDMVIDAQAAEIEALRAALRSERMRLDKEPPADCRIGSQCVARGSCWGDCSLAAIDAARKA